jgi:hypothetical protein
MDETPVVPRCDLLSHRIAAVPFTLRNLREDLDGQRDWWAD